MCVRKNPFFFFFLSTHDCVQLSVQVSGNAFGNMDGFCMHVQCIFPMAPVAPQVGILNLGAPS